MKNHTHSQINTLKNSHKHVSISKEVHTHVYNHILTQFNTTYEWKDK